MTDRTASGVLWDEVAEGTEIPPYTFDLTYKTMMLAASATRDYNPLHHDPEYARQSGVPTIFINVMTYQALFGRLLGNWLLPNGKLRSLSLKMLEPNMPGDVLTVRGTVTGKGEDHETGYGQAKCDLWIENARIGRTTVASAVVALPRRQG